MAARAEPVKEAEISEKLKGMLNKAGVLSYKMTVYVDPKGRVYGEAGWPDWLVIVPGPHYYYVELKADRGRLTKKQIYIQEKLRYCGANVVTLYGMEQVRYWHALMKARHSL